MRNQTAKTFLVLMLAVAVATACGSGGSAGAQPGASKVAETPASSTDSPTTSPARTPSPLKTVTLPAPICNGSNYAPTSFTQTTLDLDAGKVTTRDVLAPEGTNGRNPFSADKSSPSTPANRWIEYYVASCVVNRIALASNMFSSPNEVHRQPADLNACEAAGQGGSVGADRADLGVELLVGKQFCVIRQSTDGDGEEGLYFAVETQRSPSGTITITYATY
ncbi:hypothetical protein OHA77_02655 [Streptosporangium sp. NBC_01639]|uniref:hypothetical protein n=1 Tax=Streptosporangium sp. NBC_01639 TaxID=2975948 RepID=UPI0038634050|nr:hypothetical protein OHA77_02655 [Streptosporangium sp. NBC_01639]